VTRVRLIVRGRVQGVGFRANTQRKAAGLGLTGWVKNLEDGAVEALAEGPIAAIDEFVSWCGRGPSGARVESVEVLERGEGRREFAGFDVTA
jgi:acylphosphatase